MKEIPRGRRERGKERQAERCGCNVIPLPALPVGNLSRHQLGNAS